jgi:putative transcriptional regulator
LEQCSEETVSPDLLEKTLAKLDAVEDAPSLMERTAYENLVNIPRPLRRFIKSDFDSLNWSGLSKNIRELTLDIDDGRYTTKLFRIKAGQELPEHTHEGNEYTLVMSGSFSDRTCDYSKGDFILADQSTTHQPRASMDQDCICLAVMDAPLKMTGFFGRMLNPFLR